MIYLHIGKPRSGKTYDVIRAVILPALQAGRRVLTNIEGLEVLECREWIAQRTGADVDQLLIWLDDSAIRFHKWYFEPQDKDCIVIDECQIFWPGGSLKPSDPEAFAFMTRHGHYNVDIHLITQSEKNLDPHMRRLCAQTQLYRKLGFIGLSGSYQVQYFNGSEPSSALLVSSQTKRYDPEIFKAYKSIVDGASVPQSKQANILVSKKFIFLYIFLLFVVIYTARSCSKGFLKPSTGSSASVSSSPVALAEEVSSAVHRFTFRSIPYTSFLSLGDGLYGLRLVDGSTRVVRAVPQAGAVLFTDSVFYVPAFIRGKDD